MVAARVQRIGGNPALVIVTGRDIDTMLGEAGYCPLLIVDSVQTMVTADHPNQGTRNTVLAVANAVVDYCHYTSAVAIIVVHQAKGGGYAGPGTLEHLVDASLELIRQPRALGVVKNRYGVAGFSLSVNMTDKGLEPVLKKGEGRKRRRWRFKVFIVAMIVLFLWALNDGAHNIAQKAIELQQQHRPR